MKKSSKYAIVVIAVVVILWLSGVLGAFAGVLASVGQPAPEGAQGVFSAIITAGTVAVAAETAVINVDGNRVDLYSGLADWQTVADAGNIVLTFDLSNENAGETTAQYQAEGSIVSVPQPAGGTGTSYIVARDGNGLWDVDYGGFASGTEPQDDLLVTVAALATDADITVTLEASAAGFDNFQLAGNYDLSFVIGGVTLTMGFHVTGA